MKLSNTTPYNVSDTFSALEEGKGGHVIYTT